MNALADSPFGAALPRADGPAKVTGRARYAAEYPADGLVHGVVVPAAVATGRILRIDDAAARAVPGVLHVLTHANRLPMARFDLQHKDMDAPPGAPFRPLWDDLVHSEDQPVAVVFAESFEAARHAATLLRIDYAPTSPRSELLAHRADTESPSRFKFGYQMPPAPTGDVDAAWSAAPHRVAARYDAATEFHNPMEMHATTVLWNGPGKLTVYDKTQGAQNVRFYLANVLKLRKRDIRVFNPYVGGAFGSGLRPNYNVVLAAMGALVLRRPVRVVLTRPQMFSFGHRPETVQQLRLACDAQGRLQAVEHVALAETSRSERYAENLVNWAGLLYGACPNVRLGHRLVPLDRFTPLDMRAPGAALGVYALEAAMDELAEAAQMDPLALRLANYTERDELQDRPYSSKALRACYLQGAERFGWAARPLAPRSMRRGRNLVGWGMATGVWDAMQLYGAARAVLSADGQLVVSSATADIGTGTYTVMAQIAAAALGLPMAKVRFVLGDSDLPAAPIEGGSFTVASIGPAVADACEKLGRHLLTLARLHPERPLGKPTWEEVAFAGGDIHLKADPSRRVAIASLVQAHGRPLEAKALALPNLLRQRRYSRHTHSAVFCEVEVDADFGTVHVTRVVSAIAAGRIVNPLTASSQIIGGVVWGIGMALHEEGQTDHRIGRTMNHNLADYHVPANADIGSIDVLFVPEVDTVVNPLGVKGVGEIGTVGVAAAVGNAIWHATGRRVRSLPFTLDKVRGDVPPPRSLSNL